MKEQLVSFETAKLAKEKGFDWRVTHRYQGEDLISGALYNSNDKEEQALWNVELISVPSQSLLQKWLRDEHNIDVWAQPFVMNNNLPDESYSYFLFKDGSWIKDGVDYLDFEDALESGLYEALKLINGTN